MIWNDWSDIHWPKENHCGITACNFEQTPNAYFSRVRCLLARGVQEERMIITLYPDFAFYLR